MKVIVAEPGQDASAPQAPRSWYFVADSSLVNTGKPFFIPEFADDIEAFLVPIVRINRIGKTISRRFAERYYSEIAVGVHFRASELRRQLLSAGLPPDRGHSFDRSLTVGEWLPADELIGKKVALLLNGEERAEWCGEGFRELLGEFLEEVSRSNTIKMGDYLVAQLSEPVAVKIGDLLTVCTQGAPLYEIHIR